MKDGVSLAMRASIEKADAVTSKGVGRIRFGAVSNRLLIVAFIFIIGIAAVVPFYFSRGETLPDGQRVQRIVSTHDLGTMLAMMAQFDKVFKSGVFYPRWFPDNNNGYGIATPNFYPPGLLYTASLVNTITKNWINTLFLISAFGLVASGLTFYLLSRTFYSKSASAVAAIIYM